MREYQTLDKLQEKIYLLDDNSNENDIDNQLEMFFQELLRRKRDDPFEDGLQAGGIIYPDKFAFKVNENDGMAPHTHTFETLAQYIDGETKFSEIETIGYTGIRHGDPHSWLTINRQGFTIRILMGKDHLVIAIETTSNLISIFQLNIIKKIINITKTIFEQRILSSISINYLTKKDNFLVGFEPMTEEQFNDLDNLIESKIDQKKVL